jgi:hypothetical protein
MNGLWLASYLFLWLLFVLLLLGLLATLRQIGILHQQAGLPAMPKTKLVRGERVPDLALRRVDGARVRLSACVDGPALAVIVSPSCGGCIALLEQIARGGIAQEVAERIVLITVANSEDALGLLKKTGVFAKANALVDVDGAVRREWGIATTPTTVHIDEQFRTREQNVGFFSAGAPVTAPATPLEISSASRPAQRLG